MICYKWDSSMHRYVDGCKFKISGLLHGTLVVGISVAISHSMLPLSFQ